MNTAWIKPLAIRMRQGFIKNAPHILMGLGTVSGVTGMIFAVQATPKALQAKLDAEFVKNDDPNLDIKDLKHGIKDGELEKLTKMELIKFCGKYYIPAIGMELFSLVCFWGAHGIDIHRQAILAGFCSTAEQALIDYQRKVAEMIGDKNEKEIRNAMAQDKVDRDPPPSMVFTDTDCWCYYKGYKFRSNYPKLKDIQNDANKELIDNMYLSESDLLWMFDPERRYVIPDKDSRMIGWTVDRLMEFDILPTITPDHHPALSIEIRDKDGHEYMPRPGYYASL